MSLCDSICLPPLLQGMSKAYTVRDNANNHKIDDLAQLQDILNPEGFLNHTKCKKVMEVLLNRANMHTFLSLETSLLCFYQHTLIELVVYRIQECSSANLNKLSLLYKSVGVTVYQKKQHELVIHCHNAYLTPPLLIQFKKICGDSLCQFYNNPLSSTINISL